MTNTFLKNDNYLKIILLAKIRLLGRNSKIGSGEDILECLDMLQAGFMALRLQTKRLVVTTTQFAKTQKTVLLTQNGFLGKYLIIFLGYFFSIHMLGN